MYQNYYLRQTRLELAKTPLLKQELYFHQLLVVLIVEQHSEPEIYFWVTQQYEYFYLPQIEIPKEAFLF